MVIDFDKIEEIANHQFKGGDGDTLFRTFYDGTNKIMRGRLEAGCTIGYHSHDTNNEIIFIVSGKARCRYDGGEETLSPGQCHYCPRGHSHSLMNDDTTQPLIFFAIVA